MEISQPLIERLIELGFDKQVLAAKASLQLRGATRTANLGERYTRATLKAGCGTLALPNDCVARTRP